MISRIEALKGYQNKIIDLSRRNRLLKYPKTARAITFDLTPGEFQKTFGTLDEFRIDFPHRAILKAEENEDLLYDPGENEDSEEEYIPPTNPSGQKLINLLNTLRLDTRRKFEEHGLHSLFLTFGKVRWKEPLARRGSSGAVNEYDYNAPILLVPIQVSEIKRPKTTIVTSYLDEQDITVNKVLSLLLETQYSARPLNLEEAHLNNVSRLMSRLHSQIKDIFAELNIACEITEDIQIGQYSFHGQQIYEDLQRNEQVIVKHAFIDALCGHTPIRQQNLSVATDNPDVLLTKENDFNVLDADVSQLQVVQKGLQGNHLTIQGPPGTGKSQTIVNLVSNFLARQKTVLVVCEKQVALEVVLTRLKKTGLDKLCLPLFHHNADKKEFAKTVIKDRDYVAQLAFDWQDYDAVLGSRQQRIKKLRDYASALGEVISPLGKTVQWVHGELARVQSLNEGVLLPWGGPDPLSLGYDEYRKLMAILESLTPVFTIPSQEEYAHWQTIKRTHFSPDFVSRVNQTLMRIRTVIENCHQHKTQLVTAASIAQMRAFLSLAQQLSIVRPLDGSLNSEEDLFTLSDSLSSGVVALDDYIRTASSLSKRVAIPFRWKQSETLLPSAHLLRSSIIEMVREARNKIEVVAERSRYVHQECLDLPSRDVIAQSSIDELISIKQVLLIDPIIQHLQNWNKAGVLHQALSHLENLATILSRIEAVKQVITRRAIVPEELDADLAKAIAERFEEKYKYFYRFIYPSYRKDRRTIREWCSTDIPKSHREYEEIALAVKEWFKLNARFDRGLEVFTREQGKPAVRIERRIIPRLYLSVKFLLEWLNTTGKQEIPEAYTTLVEENDGSPKLKSALEALETIQAALIPIRGIFGSKELDTRLSLTLLSELLPQLEGDVVAALTLYETVKALLPVGSEPKTVGELECDAGDIDLLSTKLVNIQSLNLEAVLRGNDMISNAIASPDRFRMLAENIQAAKRVCDRLLQNRQRRIVARRAFEIIQALQTNMPVWQHYMEQYSKQADELNRLFENDASIQHLEPLPFDHFLEKLLVMSTDVKGLEAWTLYRRYTGQLENLGQSWFIAETKDKEVQPAPLFAQSLWSAWLEAHYQNNPVLYQFNQSEHHKLIEEFRRLEDDVLRVNALRILKSAAPSINQAKRYGRRQDAELVHQSQLQKRHKPIRRLVQTCGNQLQHYKPCWMMSPLTLSSYIPFGSLEFDVVIFDEASQMRVEHSLGAIARANQVLILGDEHQLPPTSFFEVISESADEEEAADIDYESILHAAKAILPGADELLSYHYRSKFEELIAFSNHYIYDDRLITFPNPEKQHKAVVFEYVENGVYDSGATRRNVVEASRIIELCAAVALEYPDRSIGVIAFSKAQEQAIRDARLTYIKRNPQLESRLDEESDAPDPFFIKNLETVQGDERDIIVLSIGYGRDKQGNIYNRFGPINTQYGYRRLNVAVTRAKEKVICVSSLKAGDIRPSERARGAQLLQKYLEYAEQGIKVLQASLLVQNQLGIEPDSPFELEVENALKRRGYNVHRQVGASGYKIDLAVVNPSNNQEYVLGIECDGASYHSSYSARVNDRIRQEILERLGWKVYRIWSQHWISNREEIIEDIVRVISDNSIPDFPQPRAGANLLM